ncbi:MAG TPA: DNA mismatch repair protein MutS [Bacteroidales bacterium]|nr:MAG: DNA mismatch repair protein MutS [Bacteroidetes bacterium HGW-Bacteroidetes-22]HAQ64347.1 DNA mismatch repair protein MutS [Bacteroidales bacterium]HBZ65717.1 DNA mismatch repair protein MutS [Bacteroidales bacterium]
MSGNWLVNQPNSRPDIMQLKSAIEELESLRFVIEALPLQSAPSRHYLMALHWISEEKAIKRELAQVVSAMHFIEANEPLTANIRINLAQIRDIRGTLRNIKTGSTPDDIELFELKHFWLLADGIKRFLSDAGVELICLPDMGPVMKILDPEGNRIPTFYICDNYDDELAALRKAYNNAHQRGEKALEEQLKEAAIQREEVVRQHLGEQLHVQYNALRHTMDQLVYLDILLSKAILFKQWNFTCPELYGEGLTNYHGLFNPLVKKILEAKGEHFQPVDITFGFMPTLITGANMAGKTVLLKTVALSQLLVQFGFFVPASEAVIRIVDQVMLSVGDQQSELQGLSSFGAEMVRITGIIRTIRSGKKVLALIDEPARTTNPTEGLALVKAIVELFEKMKVAGLITTHYSGTDFTCRKLRVKGFTETDIPEDISIGNLIRYLDYNLVEDTGESLPHEALRIAGILGVDNELIERAQYYVHEEDRVKK